MPLPMPLVVKNGSCARSKVFSSIPSPVSVTGYRQKHLARGPIFFPLFSLPQAIVKDPPCGMASRAFTVRLIKASSSWFASISIVETSGAISA